MDNIVQGHDVDFYLSHSPELNEDLDMFCALYNPVSISNDPIPEFDHSQYNIDKEYRPRNVWSMFYNRFRVFNLLKDHVEATGIKYDIVISHRLDVFCLEPLDLNLIRLHSLCIPDDIHCDGINDKFAFGTMEAMENYMNVYSDFIRILESNKTNRGAGLAEIILRDHLMSVNTVPYRFPFKSVIIRDTEYLDHIC
jgi:hypothetical protein